MAFTLDAASRQQLILSAAVLAGADADSGAVHNQIERLVTLVAPDGAQMQKLDYFLERYEKTVESTKTFQTVLVNVDIETSSKRGVVFGFSEDNGSKFHKPFEAFRTDRTDDNVRGEATKSLIKQAGGLLGHLVVVTIRIEKTKDDVKVRVLESIEDRGLYQGEIPEFSMEVWDSVDKSAPKSSRLQRGSQGKVYPMPVREAE